MNRLLKFGKWFSIGLFSLLIFLLLTAELAEDFIVQQAVNEINKSINADIKVNEVSFSLVKRFPYASLEFDTVSLKENNKKDTILAASKLFASLNPFALINNKIKIERVGIKNASFSYLINKDGASNIDFLIQSDTVQDSNESSSNNFSIGLKKLILSNVTLKFNDQQNNVKAEVTIVKTKAKGKINPKNIKAEISGNAFVQNCSYPNTKASLLKKLNVKYHLKYNNNQLKILDFTTTCKGVNLNANGNIGITDGFPSNIQISKANLNLSELYKYIPNELINQFHIKKTEGILSASGNIQGNLIDSILPKTNFTLQFDKGKFAVDTFPEIDDLAFKINLATNKSNFSDAKLNINSLHIATKENYLDTKGSVISLTKPQFQFESKIECKPEKFKKFFPKDILEQLEGDFTIACKGKGKIDSLQQIQNPDFWLNLLQSNIKIKKLNCKTPDLLAKDISVQMNYANRQLVIDSLFMNLPDFGIHVKNTSCKSNFSGSVLDLKSLQANLNDLQLQINNSSVKGSFQINNLETPNYTAHLDSKLVLEDFTSFIPDTLVQNVSGISKFTIDSKGEINLDKIEEQMMDLLLNKTQIQASCENVNLTWQSPKLNISDFSTSALLKKDSIQIGYTKVDIEGIECNIDTCHISNHYKSVIENKNEKINIYTDIHLKHFDYTKVEELQNRYFKWAEQNSKPVEQEQITESTPTNYKFEVKGRFTGDGVKYNKTEVSNISSLFNLRDTVFTFNQFKFNIFKGSFDNAFKCTIYPNGKMRFKMHVKNENIDFNNLLSDFDNFKEFGMDSLIRAEQISGKLTSNLHSEFNFKDSLDMNSLRVRGDLTLKNGGVYNYPAIEALGSFTGLKNLDSMRFETIKTNLFIYKKAVYVPKTEINSNVLNIAAFGKQAFNFDCEYHLRVYLNEILNGKTERVKRKQKQNKTKKNGGTAGLKSLFVMRKVEDGKTQNTLSAKSTRNKMKTKIKIQDEILKVYFLPMVEKYLTGLEKK
jgi:hypothetical protein